MLIDAVTIPSSQPDLDAALDALPASYDTRHLNPFGLSAPAAPPMHPPVSSSQQAQLDAVASIFASQGVLTPPPSQPGLLPSTPSYAQLILGPSVPAPAFGDPLGFDSLVAAPRAESHEAFLARMAQVSSPVPTGPIGPPVPHNWTKQPDRPDTAEEIEQARRANALGITATFEDFDVPLPYVAPVASIDEEAIDWPSSQEDVSSLCRAADSLALQFPAVPESMLIIALSLSKYDALEASNWILNLSQNRGDASALAHAFPDAHQEELTHVLKKSKQSFRGAYWLLARSFKSTWEPSIIGPNPVANALTLDDDESTEFFGLTSDFTSATQSHSDFESRWWNATSLSRSHSVQLSSPASDQWTAIARFGMNTSALAPRTIGYIHNLGTLLTAPRDYHVALQHLKVFPSYRAVTNYVLESGNSSAVIDAVTDVLHGLFTFGLTTPGATAWLAETLSADQDLYRNVFKSVRKFGPKFQEVWKQRNAALHRWRQIKVTSSVNPPSASGYASQPQTVALPDSASGRGTSGAGDSLRSPAAHRNTRSRATADGPYPVPSSKRPRPLTIVIESSSDDEQVQDAPDPAAPRGDPQEAPRSSPQQITLTGKRVTRASLLKKDGKMSRASRDYQAVKKARKKELLQARKKKGGKGRQLSPPSDDDSMVS